MAELSDLNKALIALVKKINELARKGEWKAIRELVDCASQCLQLAEENEDMAAGCLMNCIGAF